MTTMARQQTNAVKQAQRLVSYLDSSFGEVQPLFDALESLKRGQKAENPPFDIEVFEAHINQLESALGDAWDVLEDNTEATPLMSETYINWSGEMDDEPEFRTTEDVSSIINNIQSSLNTARDELTAAQNLVATGPTLSASTLKGDYGVYNSLGEYMDYVYSQVQAMCEMADSMERAL